LDQVITVDLDFEEGQLASLSTLSPRQPVFLSTKSTPCILKRKLPSTLNENYS